MEFTKEQMQVLWEAWSEHLPQTSPQAIDDLINEFSLWCESKGIKEAK